jgi:hypothetical protein
MRFVLSAGLVMAFPLQKLYSEYLALRTICQPILMEGGSDLM